MKPTKAVLGGSTLQKLGLLAQLPCRHDAACAATLKCSNFSLVRSLVTQDTTSQERVANAEISSQGIDSAVTTITDRRFHVLAPTG